MNKKGFTLVEVLAVMVILGLLISFVSVSVISIKKKQDIKNGINTVSSLLTGTRTYLTNNKNIAIKKDDTKDNTIPISDGLLNSYVGIDDSDLKTARDKLGIDAKSDVIISICENNPNKFQLSYGDYSDCGCESQNSEFKSKALCDVNVSCSDGHCAGWNTSGEYFNNDKEVSSDSSKDIK